ncbi:CLUMA_CG014034, isoform A [Clunio marinus]|uniref:CLUMA_CG014034, isoform A n=1 Tax=Clunio marinus TaxID=568069 RepID=A0A1J1IKM3_9DIPT|nr:CLUMA_CG014034, isoform A [Clunio marinus]
MLNPNDIVYDVFAGVGPFAVPAGKKHVIVLANDLNPESYKWLEHNVNKNKTKISKNRFLQNVQTFNKDGRDFIKEDVKNHLLKLMEKENVDNRTIHIVMNLPAMAVEFLDSFVGLLKDVDKGFEKIQPLICHCYCFVKGVDDTKNKIMAEKLVENHMKIKLIHGVNLKEIAFVRNVAPNKDMMRVDLFLTSDILRNSSDDYIIVPTKRKCNKVVID